jgi:RNA polymerase sigma-70 factor (ECF subfamily)
MGFPLLSAEEQADLVARVEAGDQGAEARIAELFAPAIRAMARVRSRGSADPQDVCQDVLIAVITGLRRGQLRDAGRLAAFVAGVARNVISNELRVRRARPAQPLEELHAVADLRDEMARRDRTRMLHAALKDVSESDKQVLVLSLVDGLKSGEVASRLGLDAQVVRARKSRALRRLVDRLKGT